MKYAEQNFIFKQVSYKYVFNVFLVGREREWGGVGANSRLGAYFNKYGTFLQDSDLSSG